MMKVYQPVCPDMKFRLVADLSPDGVEVSEDSTVSSDSASCLSDDDDIKMKVHEDSPAATPHPLSRYPCNRFSPSSASATPVSASDIRQEDEVSSAVTESACLRSELLLSASAQPSAMSGGFAGEETHASGADCTDNCLGRVCPQAQSATAGTGHSTSHKDGMVQLPTSTQSHGEKIVPATAHMNGMSTADSAASCAMQKPVCVYEKIYNSIKPFTQQEMDKDDDCMCGGGGGVDGDSDDDNASIEDVSISHNVPMCPPSPAPFSPARTPPIARKMMKAKADREAKAVSSSSSSSRAGRHEQSRSSRLHLDVNTPSKKPGSPYTLACAITPSPLLEQTSLATALASASSGEPADPCPPLSSCEATAGHAAATQPPEQLPESPDSPQGDPSDTSAMNRSIYDEIQEALIKEVSGDTLEDHPPAVTTADKDPAQQYPFIHKHMGHLFDKKRLLIGYASVQPVRHRDVSTSPCRSGYSSTGRSRHVSAASTASEAATSVEEALYMNRLGDRPGSDGEEEEEVIGVSLVDDEPDGAACATVFYGQKRRRKNSDGDGSRRHSSSTMATPYSDLEVTHRGMHRFIPRHADEVQIGIGDPIHVVKEFDDLWCEGVNLRSGERGIFPAMYANDLTFLEESEDEDEHWKFTMRFLGTVEVTSASGDVALCQAINKVAQQERIRSASLCILEINQYGIRMIDKSKEGHESQKFSFFFALKNISFCGTHPNNNRYFAFITKHPHEARFACHVFHSERSTHRARDALGKAFKRFYQEYMAFTHPTEDIWIE